MYPSGKCVLHVPPTLELSLLEISLDTSVCRNVGMILYLRFSSLSAFDKSMCLLVGLDALSSRLNSSTGPARSRGLVWLQEAD